MMSLAVPKHEFPMQFGLKGQTVLLRPLAADDREPMITFAEALSEDDLLFLERDITQPAEVEAWVNDTLAGRLVTLAAWEDHQVVGYATYSQPSARWLRHVAELRVVVAQSARGIGIGRLLLELVFEMVLEKGVTKVVARMTPEQTGALKLFQRLGFAEEAVLRDHALTADGLTHDLLVFSFHASEHPKKCCELCGSPVLDALVLDGSRLCSNCYESQYSELGGG
jgi:L-amino acid N-acyltransferase YncA